MGDTRNPLSPSDRRSMQGFLRRLVAVCGPTPRALSPGGGSRKRADTTPILSWQTERDNYRLMGTKGFERTASGPCGRTIISRGQRAPQSGHWKHALDRPAPVWQRRLLGAVVQSGGPHGLGERSTVTARFEDAFRQSMDADDGSSEQPACASSALGLMSWCATALEQGGVSGYGSGITAQEQWHPSWLSLNPSNQR